MARLENMRSRRALALVTVLAAFTFGCAPGEPGDIQPVAQPAESPTPVGPPGPFPDASNTGVPEGTALTAYEGPCQITVPNTVLDSKIITCDLTIETTGVMVTRSRINGSINSYGLDSGYSFQILDSEVAIGDRPGTGIGEVNFTATRVEVTGGNRSVNCYSNCTVSDSYLHGQFTDDSGQYHEGAVRMGENSTIRHNTLVCDAPDVPPDAGCSAPLTGYGDFAPVRYNLVEGNLFKSSPAAFCAYGGSSPDKPYSNDTHHIVFRDNVFERGPSKNCGKFGPILHFKADLNGNVWENNTWTDGKKVKPFYE